ncbi:MAG TPA: hypothetical protein VFA26_04500, partial [Gemmataceae bacterium]|nr:hypothetical protein [Gemmataceae bacterium]
LEPRDRGDQPLALAPLRYRTGPDGEWATVNWQPVPARVTTEVVAVDPKEIRPITPPEEVPPARSWPGWLIWAGVALAGLGLLAGGWELRRRLAGGAASPPPEKWAARELDRVAALPLNNEDEVARFHTELSDVVRRYLELRFQLRAPRQTTAEFLESMRDAPQLTGEQQALLRDLLERCDLAKFARAAAPPEECQAAAAMARTFVQQTAAPAKPATSARQGKG